MAYTSDTPHHLTGPSRHHTPESLTHPTSSFTRNRTPFDLSSRPLKIAIRLRGRDPAVWIMGKVFRGISYSFLFSQSRERHNRIGQTHTHQSTPLYGADAADVVDRLPACPSTTPAVSETVMVPHRVRHLAVSPHRATGPEGLRLRGHPTDHS